MRIKIRNVGTFSDWWFCFLSWGSTITFLITGDWKWFAVAALVLADENLSRKYRKES